MKIIRSVNEFIEARKTLSGQIGFVPTMGALHEGHKSLIEKSVLENKVTSVSIFVNPTQFDLKSDLENYPVTLGDDIEILEKAGVDIVFIPSENEMYADRYNFRVSEQHVSKILEGRYRHGHFNGVLTVVMKLLNIVKPHRLYLGEKDFQQYKLIDEMIIAFFMGVEVVACPTIREIDGLAMSSRNRRLTDDQKKKAHMFYKLLKSEKTIEEIKTGLRNESFEIDYIEEWQGRRLGAVHIGKVRLIDNVKI